MADLDDFFAKKDKKKSKSKKFVTSELKQLEQIVTKEKEQSKNNNDDTTEGTVTNENNDENDEEWGEFEESKRPDLSNLKLGQLTFDEEQHNQNAGGGGDNESENMNQFNSDGDSSENPWRKAQQDKSSKEQKPATVAAAVESKPGVYVPRFGGETAAKARKKNAPDLKSEGMFPSLGTDKPIAEVKNKKDGFKEVTQGHGIKKDAQSTSSNFQIPVSTVYSSLFNNEVDS